MKRLVINADDYGLTPMVSRGIRDAYLNGVLTSTTVMATGISLDVDLLMLKSECPDIGIGVHLTLTNLSPVLYKDKISSLLNSNGNFFPLDELKRRIESINYNELYQEWKAQIDKVKSFGIAIDHLDSHHHVCYLNDKTIDVMALLAEEYNLPVRTPVYSIKEKQKTLNKYIKNKNFFYPEVFYDGFTRKKGDLNILLELLKKIDDKAVEILSHAGIVDDELKKISSLTYSRENELESLKSPLVKELIRKEKINLMTFGEMFNEKNI